MTRWPKMRSVGERKFAGGRQHVEQLFLEYRWIVPRVVLLVRAKADGPQPVAGNRFPDSRRGATGVRGPVIIESRNPPGPSSA